MEEHRLIEQRSTYWHPGCGEDVKAGAKALRWESPEWMWGRKFPVQLGFREHLCEIEINIREPFTHVILSISHWRKYQCLSFALPLLASSSSYGIMTTFKNPLIWLNLSHKILLLTKHQFTKFVWFHEIISKERNSFITFTFLEMQESIIKRKDDYFGTHEFNYWLCHLLTVIYVGNYLTVFEFQFSYLFSK